MFLSETTIEALANDVAWARLESITRKIRKSAEEEEMAKFQYPLCLFNTETEAETKKAPPTPPSPEHKTVDIVENIHTALAAEELSDESRQGIRSCLSWFN